MTDKHEATADSPSNEGHVLRFIDGDIPIRYSKHDDWVFGGEELGRKPVTHNDLWEIQSAIINLEILQEALFERMAVTETAALEVLRIREKMRDK